MDINLNFLKLITIVLYVILLGGCQSTSIPNVKYTANPISVKNRTVFYQSRCSDYTPTELDKSRYYALSKTRAKYPKIALQHQLEGYVKFEFDISQDGVPINLNVIESTPGHIFHLEAAKSLSKWKYEPFKTYCHGVQLDFKLR